MVDATKHRSSSLSSLDRKHEPEIGISSGLVEANSRRAQSSDSLLSLSQNTGVDPDAHSQISLPEYIVDSEGYSSFRSNFSSSSSPFSSNQTSPTGDEELLINSLDEDSIKNHSENSHHWKPNLMARSREMPENLLHDTPLHAKDLLNGSQDFHVLENVDYGKNWKSCSEEKTLLDGSQNRLLSFEGASSNAYLKKYPDEDTDSDSRPSLGSLLLERQMSTIEECYEETPSPRSYVEIDKSFANAYKANIWYPTSRSACEQRNDKDTDAETRASESLRKVEDIILRSPVKGSNGVVKNHFEKVLETRGADCNVKEENNCRKMLLTSSESALDDCFQDALANDRSLMDLLGLESLLRKDGAEFQELSALSDQVFDIDLDLYDIPQQRRQSLEIKLSNLRKFVDRMIADRKCLENDRLYLQQTLQMIEGQRCAIRNGVPVKGQNNMCTSTPERNVKTRKHVEEIACSTGGQIESNGIAGATSKVCELECATSNVHRESSRRGSCDSHVEKRSSKYSTDLEELLCNLEDALLENIELKHMNKDLASANEELRERIEELLTDEEELRYKLNEATLKLMEDGERQKEENNVLRSNFNKVLRDYNSLEIEFKELERNYEELILERDLLADELSVKNEDYLICKDECTRLADELEHAKEELERYCKVEERVWTRTDWEQWTVLQAKISATELALFDARKQKSQLVADLKRMKKLLESGKEKIEDTEKSIAELEKNLKRAQAKNESLLNENAELRNSILKYEAKYAEFERLAEERLLKEETKFMERYFGYGEREEGACIPNIDEDWTNIESNNIIDDKLNDENDFSVEGIKDEIDNLTVLRSDKKSGDIRRARTFPLDDIDNLALQLFQEKALPTDTYADSQYQSAFQEIERDSNEYFSDDGELSSATACASTNTFAVRVDVLNNAGDSVKKRHRPTCFSLKGLLPSVLHGILNSKAKNRKHNKSPSKSKNNANDV